MTTARRWWIVAIGVLALLAAPLLVHALPVEDSAESATSLAARIQQSHDVPYSGSAESTGTLQLPASTQFGALGDLLGERTRLRTWWRSADDWRVDTVRTTGESDLFHDESGTTRWVYESLTATRTPNVFVRIPDASDLLPPILGRRLLDGARPDELSRLPAERIAGRDALGVRLRPSDQQSSIDRVEVWADPETAVPLRVEVYGDSYGPTDQPGQVAMTTAFSSFSSELPAASITRFEPPPGSTTRFERVLDFASAADAFAPQEPPANLAGLGGRRTSAVGAVAVYGRGPTLLVGVPLWDRAADPIREQLDSTAGMRHTTSGHFVGTGPLGVLLTDEDAFGTSWLLTGTVTPATLERAAVELAASGGFG
ncbi:MAG: hypothetical protein WKF83_01910 [Nocardioidaceae bacterium]